MERRPTVNRLKEFDSLHSPYMNNKKLRERVFELVNEERDIQDKRWGGPDHDDKHHNNDWILFIFKQFGKVLNKTYTSHAEIWIKIAALAVAAAESDYRNFTEYLKADNGFKNIEYAEDGTIKAICECCVYKNDKYPEANQYVIDHPETVHPFFCNKCYLVLKGLTEEVLEEPCEATCSRSSSNVPESAVSTAESLSST